MLTVNNVGLRYGDKNYLKMFPLSLHLETATD
ncbi:Uncharacterised protein [Listeria grayi]|uniref:Uncharacterized protein n=1 Tax=Listeria grayi TaxID=1641 RepID=A0A378MA53_LISGR|nr:Uncharacterised protein [Listeria grayi]